MLFYLLVFCLACDWSEELEHKNLHLTVPKGQFGAKIELQQTNRQATNC